jgi:hypothetical protein
MLIAQCAKERTMSEVLERPAAPETIPQIEAMLNYLINTGEKIVTEAGPGGTERPPVHQGFWVGARRLPLRAARHQGCRLF